MLSKKARLFLCGACITVFLSANVWLPAFAASVDGSIAWGEVLSRGLSELFDEFQAPLNENYFRAVPVDNSDSATPRYVIARPVDFEKDFPNLIIRNDAPERYLELAQHVFSILPRKHTTPLRTFIIKYDDISGRGLGGATTVILNARKNGQPMREQEFVSVLIHELGHVVDLGHLSSTKKSQASNFRDQDAIIWADDKSVQYYKFSWSDDKNRQRNSEDHDFPSEYAHSDPFEDFAEMYNLYVTHGREARMYSRSSEVFLKKYNWMKYHIFDGYEFKTGSNTNVARLTSRVWDSTLMPYNLQELFGHSPVAQ